MDTRLDRVEEVTSRFLDRCFAFEQFGPLTRPPATAAPVGLSMTRPDRLPGSYRRTHGICYLHGCYSLGDDQLWGVMRRRKGRRSHPGRAHVDPPGTA